MARTRTENREYIPVHVRQQILHECNRICAHCGTPLYMGDNFTLEHVIPLNKGGKNNISNYVALCRPCNKAKSDDIVEPKRYYTYLPKEKLEKVQHTFEKYLETTDWLGYDNLFRTDQFDLITVIPVFTKNKQIDVPSTFHVEKVRREAAFEYLTLYTGRLSFEDKQLMVYDVNDINTPYYRLTKGPDTIMMVSAYIKKIRINDDNTDNIIHLDIYANPDLKQKRTTVPTIYNLMQMLLNEMQKTLMSRDRLTVIKTLIRTPSSDNLGVQILQELNRLEPKTYSMGYMYGDTGDESSGKILCLAATLFQGDYHDLKSMAKANGYDSIDEFCKNTDKSSMESTINDRLSTSKEIRDHKPEKVKKKDKKRSKKKPRH